MTNGFHYHFEWDPAKAAGNRSKHRITFEQAATVFKDPLAMSIPDEAHVETEDRWVTLGQAENGKLLVVVHTYRELDARNAAVRLSRRGRPPNTSNANTRKRHERRIRLFQGRARQVLP